MGRLAQEFERFPHRCTIYYMSGETSFDDGVKTIVWSGRCRKESNVSIRTFRGADSVLKGDYRVQLGAKVGGELSGDADAAYDGMNGEECGAVVEGLYSGLQIDITDPQGEHNGLMISDAYAGRLGTTIYCDDAKN